MNAWRVLSPMSPEWCVCTHRNTQYLRCADGVEGVESRLSLVGNDF